MNPSLPLGVLIWRSIATILLLAAPLSAREPGIRMVRNINKSPGGFSRAINWVQPAGEKVLLVAHGDRLYFSAYDSISGTQAWMSDGTEGGTTLVDEKMRPGTGASPFISTGERLFFKGYAPKTGVELHVLVPPRNGN